MKTRAPVEVAIVGLIVALLGCKKAREFLEDRTAVPELSTLDAAVADASAPATPIRTEPDLTVRPRPNVKLTLNHEPYELRAPDGAALRRAIDRARPTAGDGKRYDAVTQWHLTWKYDFDRSPRGCGLQNVRGTLSVGYVLPRWVDQDAAPPADRARWQRYRRSLFIHERGHGDIAATGVNEIMDALARVGVARDCPTIEKRANQLGDRLLKATQQRERDYDAETDHGRTQGARFGG